MLRMANIRTKARFSANDRIFLIISQQLTSALFAKSSLDACNWKLSLLVATIQLWYHPNRDEMEWIWRSESESGRRRCNETDDEGERHDAMFAFNSSLPLFSTNKSLCICYQCHSSPLLVHREPNTTLFLYFIAPISGITWLEQSRPIVFGLFNLTAYWFVNLLCALCWVELSWVVVLSFSKGS